MIEMLPNRMYLTELLRRLIHEIQSLKNLQNIFALQPQIFSLLTFFVERISLSNQNSR